LGTYLLGLGPTSKVPRETGEAAAKAPNVKGYVSLQSTGMHKREKKGMSLLGANL